MNIQDSRKLRRLTFYLALYWLPALIGLLHPNPFQALLSLGLLPGFWRSARKSLPVPGEILLFPVTTAVLWLVIGLTSQLLGPACLPLWALLALDQAHRRRDRRAYSNNQQVWL
jgi:hypothetical protein